MTIAFARRPATADAVGSAEPGFAVSEFATGFPTGDRLGPTGIVIDRLGTLFAVDGTDRNLYKFSTAGGRAGGSTLISLSPIPGRPIGLVLSKEGFLFVARGGIRGGGDVTQLDAVNGKLVRVVASGFRPSGIATDPVSGNLFVTSVGEPIKRIANPTVPDSTITNYGEPLSDPRGIAFGPEGTLYVADGNSIIAMGGTASTDPGVGRVIARVRGAYGIAMAETTNPSEPPFLAVNSSDGSITKVDVAGRHVTYTPMVFGGGRGGLAEVGPDGCLYATRPASILKVTSSEGTCPFCGQPLALLDGGQLADNGPCGDWRSTREPLGDGDPVLAAD